MVTHFGIKLRAKPFSSKPYLSQ